jgi:hypothetical protein
VDLEDFKSFCRVLKPSGVGSIPTRSRHSRFAAAPLAPCGGIGGDLEAVWPERNCAMFEGKRRMESRWWILAAVCACVLFPASLPAVSASVDPGAPTSVPGDTIAGAARDTISPAVPDTIAASARDTTEHAGPDTSVAAPERPPWTMDELKGVLGEETGGIREGKAYKERKNGRVAMACAILIPGLGQIYNEKPLKAAIALGLESYYLSQIAMNRRLREREKMVRDSFAPKSSAWNYHDGWVTEYWERSVDWIWWSGAVVLAVVIDAYVDAKLDDMRFKVEARASDGNIGVGLLVRY